MNGRFIFGEQYCKPCRLWVDKDIKMYHCNDCNMCRIGKREDYVHCKNCDTCMVKDHKCSTFFNKKETKCPCCFESLYNSRNLWISMPCTHCIHVNCMKSMLKNGNIACPLCKHSIIDMTLQWTQLRNEILHTPMPEEYANKMVKISCNDCNIESDTLFHVLGLECKKCGSFNTQQL